MKEQESNAQQAQTFDGGISPQQVEEMRRKHRKVFRVDIVNGEETHVGYFHRPRIETMAAVTKIAKTDELKSSETMFDNCWLGGSPAMRNDTILFLEATKQLGIMLSSCRSSLKNL